MAGFSELLQLLMSCTVDLLGNGAMHGGKGMLMAGARRIGWASGGGGQMGRRFGGHSLARRSFGSGFGRGGAYNPKMDYQSRGAYRRGKRNALPAHLHGRQTFQRPDGPLGGHGSRWCGGQGRPGPCTPRPRSNIKF